MYKHGYVFNKNDPPYTYIMPGKPVLFALFALTRAVVASPLTTVELNDCQDKPVDAPCMLGSLDSLSLGLGGTCTEGFLVRTPSLIRRENVHTDEDYLLVVGLQVLPGPPWLRRMSG